MMKNDVTYRHLSTAMSSQQSYLFPNACNRVLLIDRHISGNITYEE